jgi:hypothetical protein
MLSFKLASLFGLLLLGDVILLQTFQSSLRDALSK